MLVAWGEKVSICQIIRSEFCIEIQIERDDFERRFWIILIYASAMDQTMRRQWEILKDKIKSWGKKWILGGDFNEIISQEDKIGGHRKGEGSFRPSGPL